MDADARLFRGDRIRCLPDPEWPDAPAQPIWELLCDAVPVPPNDGLEPGHWSLHVEYVTPGTCDNSDVGDRAFMLVRMEEVEFISRVSDPQTWCEGEAA